MPPCNLDALLGDQRADAADACTSPPTACARAAADLRPAVGGVDHGRASLLDFEQQVGHPMLQRLEAADRHAELLACLQIVERRRLGDVHRAERFGAQRQQAAADRLSSQHADARRAPSSASSASLTPSSINSARAAAVDQSDSRAASALAHRRARGKARCRLHRHRAHQWCELRRRRRPRTRLMHDCLVPAQLPAAAVALGARVDTC